MDEKTRRGVRIAQVGLLANAVLVVVKVLAGILGHSYALVADGIESTADIFASLIVWRGLRVAGRSPDEEYHFGYGKAESLSAAAVALMLLGAAVGIAIQAIREILRPHHVPASFTLVVLGIVVIAKELLYRRVAAVGAQMESPAVTTDAWHHRSDAITSGAAFVGIAIGVIGGQRYAAADDYAALLASAIIVVNGIRLLRPALADLMDRAPDRGLLADVVERACDVDGVRAIEKILARRVGTGYHVALHVQADPSMTLHDAHALGHQVRGAVVGSIPKVLDVFVHMEPFEDRRPSPRVPGGFGPAAGR